MKKLAMLTAAAVLAFPVVAEARVLRAHLIGYNEVPSVNSKAEGFFMATVAADGNSFTYTLSYDGLQAPVTQAHIHFSKSRINGPIVIWLCQTAAATGPAGTQACPQSGTITGTITSANVLAAPSTQQLPAGALADMISAMKVGAAYVNVHTGVSPGGEIRGQVYQFRR